LLLYFIFFMSWVITIVLGNKMFVSLMFFVWIFFNIMKFKGDGKVKVT